LRTDYIARRELGHVLAALTVPNRLALEVSLSTGLRISDVLALKTVNLRARLTVREFKTGKNRRIYLNAELLERMRHLAGRYYVFEGRLSVKRPRTRQAVWRDLKRAARAFRVEVNIAPHSARKIYAVDFYHKCGYDINKVKNLLNHTNSSITMLYALADTLTQRHFAGKPLSK
jgi:integrase